jgi:hypothetical protein
VHLDIIWREKFEGGFCSNLREYPDLFKPDQCPYELSINVAITEVDEITPILLKENNYLYLAMSTFVSRNYPYPIMVVRDGV